MFGMGCKLRPGLPEKDADGKVIEFDKLDPTNYVGIRMEPFNYTGKLIVGSPG